MLLILVELTVNPARVPCIYHKKPVTHLPMQSYGRYWQLMIPDLNFSLTRYALVHDVPINLYLSQEWGGLM